MTDHEWWAEWAGDEAVHATRERVLYQKFAEHLAAHPEMHSVLVHVAQYYADNASDEVHVDAHATDDDGCYEWHWLDDDYRGLELWSLGYGELVPAFESYCQSGSQEDLASANARPLAWLSRRGEEIVVDIIGDLIRPWLDMPRNKTPPLPLDAQLATLTRDTSREGRAVLADALADRGDPRAELFTPSSPARYRHLCATVGRTWLGSFDERVPRGGVRFEGGVPSEIQLCIDPDPAAQSLAHLDLDDPLPWLLAPRVRFSPSSEQLIWPGLARARAILGPLADSTLEAISKMALPLDAEEVDVASTNLPDCPLFALEDWMPRLRVVRFVGEQADLRLASLLARWRPLAKLTRVEIAGAVTAGNFARDLSAFAAARLPVPVHVAMLDPDTCKPSGWSIRVGDGVARVEHIGYHPAATPDWLAGALTVLPRSTRVEAVPSRYWRGQLP
jgi:hypothetical protein